ncbi:hypothetical protein LCGC14_2483580 [marine sediment metagenome]|uniref:Uncharacterized protein n=1 Tax=marine sediment metagenome TaxID=412755 RepID=A0A0F9BUL6_9ZZZZ
MATNVETRFELEIDLPRRMLIIRSVNGKDTVAYKTPHREGEEALWEIGIPNSVLRFLENYLNKIKKR